MNFDTVNAIYTSQKSSKIGFCEELERYLNQVNQSIDVNKWLLSNGTLTTTFRDPSGEENKLMMTSAITQLSPLS